MQARRLAEAARFWTGITQPPEENAEAEMGEYVHIRNLARILEEGDYLLAGLGERHYVPPELTRDVMEMEGAASIMSNEVGREIVQDLKRRTKGSPLLIGYLRTIHGVGIGRQVTMGTACIACGSPVKRLEYRVGGSKTERTRWMLECDSCEFLCDIVEDCEPPIIAGPEAVSRGTVACFTIEVSNLLSGQCRIYASADVHTGPVAHEFFGIEVYPEHIVLDPGHREVIRVDVECFMAAVPHEYRLKVFILRSASVAMAGKLFRVTDGPQRLEVHETPRELYRPVEELQQGLI
jgi:hypothetical protein